MPFTRTQSMLKRVIPKRYYAALYKSASCTYRTLCELADKMHYVCLYVYYLLKRDPEKVKKIRAIYSIRPYTMVDRVGLFDTYDIAYGIESKKMVGSFVECGVARGGSSALMAIVASKSGSGRNVWLFDSFEGLPAPTAEDKPCAFQRGGCLGTYQEVSELLFSLLGLDRNSVFLVPGWFQDTLPDYKDKIGKISFLRLDADLYESIKCCLESLYDNVVTGGYVLIDDYKFAGCRRAVDEFLQKRNLDVELVSDNHGRVYFTKP